MKIKHLLILILIGIVTFSSCNKNKLFEQPTVEVENISLKELPGDYTYLELDILVYNNDKRDALIKDVEYQAVIEGFTAETENVDVNKKIETDEPLALTLPLTLKTKDAIQLLTMVDKGQELEYVVTGTFHVDEPIKNLFDLPIDVQGKAVVDIGFEDFYEQPEVTVDGLDITSTSSTADTYTYEFDVECTVKNMDNQSVTIDEVEYIVYIAGIESSTHFYSDTYSSDISITGGGSLSLTLPVTLVMNATQESTLNDAIASGTIDYVVEGTFHATKVDGTASDFLLPLYITGDISVQEFFEQPETTVNSFSGTYVNNITSYTINLDVNTTIDNLDSRDVIIDEVEYVVTVEGIESSTHYYTDTYVTNLSVTGLGTVTLDLPVSLLINDPVSGAAFVAGMVDGTAAYTIEGSFHAIDVDGVAVDITLPLNDSGTCPVTSFTGSK